MNRHRLREQLLTLLVVSYGSVSYGADPGHLEMGPVQVTPSLDIEHRYDDNVYRIGDKTSPLADKSSSVFVLAPEVDFKVLKGTSEYSVTLEAKKANFQDESAANYFDYGIMGDFEIEMSSRHRFQGAVQYGNYNDESATRSLTDKHPPENTLKRLGLTYGFGSKEAKANIDFFGRYSDKAYKKSLFRGQTIREYGATGYYRVLPKTSLVLEIKERKLDYSHGQSAGFDITSYLAGLDWEATAKTTGYAKIGRRHRDSDVSGISREGYTGWEIGMSYTPLTYSEFKLGTRRDYGLESDDPTIADFTKGTTTSLSWEHEWNERWKTVMDASLTQEEIFNSAGVTTADRDVNQYGISFDYAFRRWMILSLGYQYSKRDETIKISTVTEDDFKRNLYLISCTLTL